MNLEPESSIDGKHLLAKSRDGWAESCPGFSKSEDEEDETTGWVISAPETTSGMVYSTDESVRERIQR